MSQQPEKAVTILDDAAQREQPLAIQPASETAAILSVIERAAQNPNVDIEKMERLFEMRERALDRAAREAFSAALAEMQPKLPVIVERGSIDLGKGKPQSYALWEDINEAIRPALAEHGFALSFRTGRDGDKPTVTGILSHKVGHREETTMVLPIDTSGSKNAVQAIGSSTSYGKRYTAAALLNLTSRLREDRDDDGASAAGPSAVGDFITMEEVAVLRKALEFVGKTEEKFCAAVKVHDLASIRASDFDKAVRIIQNAGGKQ